MPGTCYLSELDLSDKTFLDADPAFYENGPPDRRASDHQTQDGTVRQDFAFAASDRSLRLRTDWMTTATLAAFEAKFGAVAKVWRWHDDQGADYDVFFRRLAPRRIPGNNAHVVEMTLDVVSIP